jgi:hypothetical protein
MWRKIMRARLAGVALVSVSALLAQPAVVLADSPSFSGQATAVQAVTPVGGAKLGDTGPLPSSGGTAEAGDMNGGVPGLLTVGVFDATTSGQGNESTSRTSVADLNLTVGSNTVGAALLGSTATAVCGSSGPAVSGGSDVASLTINGQTTNVGTQPNQVFPLPGGGEVIINEQSSSTNGNSGSIDVNALHVIVPGVADVVIAHSHADITCAGSPNCASAKDFVTGGGWITAPSGAKGNFGVGGGLKDSGFWGHLLYIDHGANGPKVKGTGVTNYGVVDGTTRHIDGNADVNEVSGYVYHVDVVDNEGTGSPDRFFINVTGPGSYNYSAGGPLGGGHIEIHKPCTA